MILIQGDNFVIQGKLVTGFALGVRYEEDLVGEGSRTLCFDLGICTIFYTW